MVGTVGIVGIVGIVGMYVCMHACIYIYTYI